MLECTPHDGIPGMSEHTVVTASDIARMAGISRAAVSNWRRRYTDFPEPVGGTATSPTYHVGQIEEWLARHGKAAERPRTEQALETLWQNIRGVHGSGDVPGLLAAVGDRLSGGRPSLPDAVAEQLDRLTDVTPLETYRFLLDRLRETAADRPSPTVPELAAVAAAVLPPAPQQVYDPACGLCGTFLDLARRRSAPTMLVGQDLSSDWIGLAAPLLRLHEVDHRLAVGDSIHADAFAEKTVDAAVCDVPVGATDRQRDRLVNDPRLTYGIPPRAEAELLWIQHCLGHVKPGGLVVASMPAAAAYRRSGRRIRAELLRRGALVAVTAPVDAGAHIWILRRPETSAPPAQVLMATTTDVADAWHRFVTQPYEPIAEPDVVTVPVVALLDDAVDVTPATRVARVLRRPVAERFVEQSELLRTVLDGVSDPAPVVVSDPVPSPTVTVAELERQGALNIETARSGSLQPGDVVVWNGPDGPRASVHAAESDAGDNGEYVVRCVEAELDPYWLAAALTAGMLDRPPTTTTGGGYVRQVSIPRLAVEEQRHRGRVFADLVDRERRLRRAADVAARLTVTAAEALTGGRLRGRA